MAYYDKALSRIASGGVLSSSATRGQSVFSYLTNDDAAAVQTSGYFNDAGPRLTKGDVILASLDLDGTPEARAYLVSAATATTATITPFKATAIS